MKTQFEYDIERATPGEEVVYHVGDLHYDRTQGTDGFGRGAVAIAQKAKAAWLAMCAGACMLYQRRVGPSRWYYVAKKLPFPHKAVVFSGAYDPEYLNGSKPRLDRTQRNAHGRSRVGVVPGKRLLQHSVGRDAGAKLPRTGRLWKSDGKQYVLPGPPAAARSGDQAGGVEKRASEAVE